MATDDTALAKVLRAFLSREERWEIREVPDLPTGRYVTQLELHGKVMLDASHISAVVRAAEEEQ